MDSKFNFINILKTIYETTPKISIRFKPQNKDIEIINEYPYKMILPSNFSSLNRDAIDKVTTQPIYFKKGMIKECTREPCGFSLAEANFFKVFYECKYIPIKMLLFPIY